MMSPARIALVGGGWWGQGWHLPHLHRNPKAQIVAIVDRAAQPTSSLNSDLLPLAELGAKYGAPVFSSVEAMLSSGLAVDGVIVCTPHATHFDVGRELLAAGSIPNVLMEKPFTTDVSQAQALHEAVVAAFGGGNKKLNSFQVNHSANWRAQTIQATQAVRRDGLLGRVQHVTCFMGSPLACIFDEPSCRDWNEPSGSMVGNGFGWGQMSHIFAWVFQVTGLEPETVSCTMTHSDRTGADVYDAGVVTCSGGATIAFSGVACLPGDAHAADGEAKGKVIECKVFGSEGAVS